MDKSQLFFCYDVQLHRTLQGMNIEYLTSAISNSNRRFWLYFRSPEVEKLLKSRVNN
jgi:hypothetical protein